jgi:hypothetical protein
VGFEIWWPELDLRLEAWLPDQDFEAKLEELAAQQEQQQQQQPEQGQGAPPPQQQQGGEQQQDQESQGGADGQQPPPDWEVACCPLAFPTCTRFTCARVDTCFTCTRRHLHHLSNDWALWKYPACWT